MNPGAPWDWRRTAIFATFGATFVGAWQYWLFSVVVPRVIPMSAGFAAAPLRQKLTDTVGLRSIALFVAVENLFNQPFGHFPTLYAIKYRLTHGGASLGDSVGAGPPAAAAHAAADAAARAQPDAAAHLRRHARAERAAVARADDGDRGPDADADARARVACGVVANANAEDLYKDTYTSMEDAYDSDTYGHATYACAERLVEDLAQYDKAEPYLWCVVGHCDDCSGSGDDGSCMTSYLGLDTADECKSATLNYLGFVNRKKTTPDYGEAEAYYAEALDLWPENCGALNYLAELYVTTGDDDAAAETFAELCDTCGPNHDHSLALVDDLGPCVTPAPSAAPSTSVAPTSSPTMTAAPTYGAATGADDYVVSGEASTSA
ncbi:hypothetical protein JL722_1883 [Aureococcus anophagefferens]|nr:hypothetical protein JL722_1883 [Aureococcus anophagefferens]